MHHKLIWLAAAAWIPVPAMAQAPTSAAKPPGGAVSEVVVTGQAPTIQTSIDRRSYSVSADLQAQSGSIGDALRNVPSVDVDVQGNVSLRGDPNVTILIDGKPSGLFRGEGKGQALQALPAERIERVEVITNPSAEFRADGTGGVINLITKKAKGAGQTGSMRITAGTSERVYANANFGYNGPKLSVAADAFLRHDPQKQVTDDSRERLDPATGTPAPSRVDSVAQADLDILGARGSVDYDVDADTRLTGELRLQRIGFDLDAFDDARREDGTGALTQAYTRTVRVEQDRKNAEATAGFRRKLGGEGHEFTFSASYERTDYERSRAGGTFSVLPFSPGAYDRQVLLSDLQQVQLKGDYVRPMGDGAKLKAGFDVQWDDNQYDNLGFRGSTAPASVPDPTLGNLFKVEQQLAQAYVTYERAFGDVGAQAGVRVEDMRIDLNSDGRTDENDYARAYPSLHLSWKASDTQTFTASYSQRVQRPEPDQFNAFRFLLDPFTYRSGNPDLQPQRTQSYEVGWQYRKAPTNLLATAYYRENDKVVTDVTRDLGGGVLLITQANVSQTRAAGVELVASGKLTSTLSYNLSGNGYWTELDAAALGISGKRSSFAVGGRGNISWQVTPDDLLQVNAFMNAKRLTAQGYRKPTGMVNLGYRHKFNDRIAGLLTVTDLLNTFDFVDVVYTPTLKTRVHRTADTRGIMIGFVWTLGGGKPRDQGFDFGGGGPTP